MDEVTAKTAKTWVLVLTSLAAFMVALDMLVVTTALSTIRVELGTSIAALEWVVNAYNVSLAVLLLAGAALGDRFGRRRIFAAGLGLFVAASAGCALAESAAALIAARAVQGAGAALAMPLALALLSAAFPREERGKVLGIFSSVSGLALILGPVVGGAVTQGLAWQWIFWINVPLGLVVIPLVLRRCPESFGPPAALDGGGIVLVSAAALALVWALVRGNELGWTSPEIMALLALGAITAIAFVAWERRVGEPMVPLRLFRSRAFSAGVAASFLFYGAMYGMAFLLPQFFSTGRGADPLGAGLRLVPWTATLFVFAPIGGRLINRIGERPLVVTGTLLQAVGFAWLGFVATPDIPFARLVVPLILAGAGVSIAMPAVQAAALGAVAPAEIGKAAGIVNMARNLGGVFGVAVAVAVFAGHGGVASGAAFTAGFVSAVAVSATLSLAAAIVALALPGRRAVAMVAVKVGA